MGRCSLPSALRGETVLLMSNGNAELQVASSQCSDEPCRCGQISCHVRSVRFACGWSRSRHPVQTRPPCSSRLVDVRTVPTAEWRSSRRAARALAQFFPSSVPGRRSCAETHPVRRNGKRGPCARRTSSPILHACSPRYPPFPFLGPAKSHRHMVMGRAAVASAKAIRPRLNPSIQRRPSCPIECIILQPPEE